MELYTTQIQAKNSWEKWVNHRKSFILTEFAFIAVTLTCPINLAWCKDLI